MRSLHTDNYDEIMDMTSLITIPVFGSFVFEVLVGVTVEITEWTDAIASWI